ncbi:MAG TPA: prepilin-type N-terminal cleavage/methylation domain-containing protein [Candidatus Acidoferrales bacterium]|nr:prepilin-type N-terminal cleavage/methylation domain-containing protein [Candidatus Acidoferrales bacterium]
MYRQKIERKAKQCGFTMMEVLIATAVLVISLVGVAQLVPLSIRLNTANRGDSTSLVIAQREMEAMIGQPITATTFTDPQGLVCAAAGVCNLGVPANPPALAGSPVVMFANRPFIDYTQAKVAGYNYSYSDPNDPANVSYDIRWAVITFTNAAGTATGRRIIVGVRRLGGNAPLLPVALDSMVEK